MEKMGQKNSMGSEAICRLRSASRAEPDKSTLTPFSSFYFFGSGSAEEILGPLLIIVGAGDPPHQLGRRDVLEVARCHAIAQRLQGVVDRLHRGRKRRVGLQCHPDAMRGEPIEITELTAATAEDQRDPDRR